MVQHFTVWHSILVFRFVPIQLRKYRSVYRLDFLITVPGLKVYCGLDHVPYPLLFLIDRGPGPGTTREKGGRSGVNLADEEVAYAGFGQESSACRVNA